MKKDIIFKKIKSQELFWEATSASPSPQQTNNKQKQRWEERRRRRGAGLWVSSSVHFLCPGETNIAEAWKQSLPLTTIVIYSRGGFVIPSTIP